jgi:hypothetical protein
MAKLKKSVVNCCEEIPVGTNVPNGTPRAPFGKDEKSAQAP